MPPETRYVIFYYDSYSGGEWKRKSGLYYGYSPESALEKCIGDLGSPVPFWMAIDEYVKTVTQFKVSRPRKFEITRVSPSCIQ